MGPIRVAPGGSRKPGNGGPSVYGGIGRSPMKVKKSPFKTKRPSVAKGDSRANNEDAYFSIPIHMHNLKDYSFSGTQLWWVRTRRTQL